jgi:hypothetical protein
MATQQQGLIAILDALGSATYSDAEIDRFLESRELVLSDLNTRAEDELRRRAGEGADPAKLHVFTFNDTVVIVYQPGPGKAVSVDDVEWFTIRLRALMIRSLRKQILFRGSLAVGKFHTVDDDTNTVLGAAVSDAAAWYDKTDWIGIAATPHTSIYIQALLEDSKTEKLDHVLVDYDVPLKDKSRLSLKAINWPKGFYVKGLRPDDLRVGARGMLHAFLAKHQTPWGTESKFFNTIAFFDAIRKRQQLGVATKVKDPNEDNP